MCCDLSGYRFLLFVFCVILAVGILSNFDFVLIVGFDWRKVGEKGFIWSTVASNFIYFLILHFEFIIGTFSLSLLGWGVLSFDDVDKD